VVAHIRIIETYALIKAVKALSDETRLKILNLLLQRECCVCEVMQVLDISQTRASRNLSMLYDAGFLKLRKEGLWAYYSIDKSSLEDYLTALLEAVETGLKDNPSAIQDVERLKKARRLGPQYCQKMLDEKG
jgi:ArsR family transcriptional regulator, arsenate/arsenite/antimonite-responsive transcriptional repressor